MTLTGESRAILLEALQMAHHVSARRENPSSMAVINAAAASGSYTSSIASALLTLGGDHGPLEATQELLEIDASESLVDMVGNLLLAGQRVPGWGHGFIKDKEDPDWAVVRGVLTELRPDLVERIDRITARLHRSGRIVYPNPSAWTAACAIAIGIPPRACAFLFVSARLRAWTDLFIEATAKEG